MKHLDKLLFAVMMLMAVGLRAQNSDNPWAISFGINAVDTKASAAGGKNVFDEHISQPFNVSEYWNILPSVSYISVAKSIGNNFSVGIQGSVNKISKFVVYDPRNPNHNSTGHIVVNPGNLMYYAVDVSAKYSFMSLVKSKVIEPSLSLGGGYNWLGDNNFASLNPGAGLTFWFTENVGLALASSYKINSIFSGDRSAPGDKYTPNKVSHFQHTAGITFQFGGKDTDGDGVYDKDDACPEVAGLKQFNGCPDTDGDGIIDGSDACPTEFGLAALNGCPDTDGDGVADKDDACPDTAGLAIFKGCPDTDGDGLADKDDKCPTVAGPKANGGCPVLDSDKDGVADKDDDCPTVAGPASNKGCPEVTREVDENLKTISKLVYFEPGTATLKKKGTPVSLEEMNAIIKNYPNAKFSVEGHTDSDGSNAYNQKLSEDRANAVKNALVAKGVNSNNLITAGFGETKPVATNKTKAGKAKNRRTELKHVSSK
ncbi:OmpA family protein [Flavobacterium sp.]|uniref:OmpA family protein n=1 Tax=Flavobacterium sp. TaxID=239 RepID=UPI00286DACCB|nr:OmpA family protein [Flavobacterium sp.]